MERPEIIVEADPKAGPLTAVKGLLLQGSLDALKALGHYDQYCKNVGPQRLTELNAFLGGEWVPLPLMDAHYQACEDLLLTPMQLDEMGKHVGAHLQTRLLATVSSAARATGFSPWTAIAPMYRMTGRMFEGTTSRVSKLGPKELETRIFGNPLFSHGYFRVAYCGSCRAMLMFLGARTTYAKVTSYDAKTHEICVRVSWV